MKNEYPLIPPDKVDDIHNIQFLENSHLNIYTSVIKEQ